MTLPILIAGAGPTGLTLALDLAQKKIPFRLIDKLETAPEHSRAFGIQPGLLLALRDAFGPSLPDALVAAGHSVQRVTVHLEGEQPIEIPLHIEAHYPFLLLLPQSETERILREHLVLAGHSIDWGQELKTFVQSADRVTATIGDSHHEHAFIAGCDGAHSAVRHILATQFDGKPYAGDFVLADVDVESPLPRSSVHVFVYERGALAAFPFRDKRWRFFVIKREPIPDDAPVTEEAFAADVRAIAGLDPGFSHFRWLTRFRLHHRLASEWRVGRAFLAGDAAHIHSPVGGQGMNLGMQDALVLGHVLGAAMHEDLDLDLYQRQRKPVARGVLRGTDLVFRQGLGPSNPLNRLVRTQLAPRLLRSPFIRKHGVHTVAQLAMAARVSAFRRTTLS